MSNYMEFKHEQSNWSTGVTFENVSTNDRLLTFEITTKDFLKYSGWYQYFLYNENKTTLLEQGKLNVKDINTKTVYTTDSNEKKIYKR